MAASPKQTPKAQQTQAKPAIAEQLQRWADRAFRAAFGLTVGWQKRRDIVQNNFELGLMHLQKGNISDAVLRFKLTTWLEPRYAAAWYQLGISQLAAGNKVAARKAFAQALALKPNYEEAAYMLALAGGASAEQLPTKMPLSLALKYFNEQAAHFAADQLQRQYQGHTLLVQAIRAALTPGRIDHVILDLGVGTGLGGSQLRDVAAHITGVDISPPMLVEAMKLQDAAGKKLYDALINREMHEFLAGVADDAFDIVLAAEVFNYVGDVQAVFAQVARVLRRGGVFAFTADKMDGHGFCLDTASGRFRFSKDYLSQLAAMHQLKIQAFDEVAIYPGEKAWLCVFRK